MGESDTFEVVYREDNIVDMGMNSKPGDDEKDDTISDVAYENY